ncbi:uncharacterized protein LAESUDRAFT_575268 [Laetiporus sulphureus 93-53]|uniref:Secreted protein n=1 Tax=Laetiporus sulphureus 93-53 TaxID=1314785 RepID=A0A165B2D6_9APHY|nr:uncharacterized protein LAESUDRAFT_575268 [Laetiporus sulphureus 93-53]KZT00098.1 hypothetical protein LAESUDRAFT_575268 [Laetiporus sulphureus 93-53]
MLWIALRMMVPHSSLAAALHLCSQRQSTNHLRHWIAHALLSARRNVSWVLPCSHPRKQKTCIPPGLGSNVFSVCLAFLIQRFAFRPIVFHGSRDTLDGEGPTVVGACVVHSFMWERGLCCGATLCVFT